MRRTLVTFMTIGLLGGATPLFSATEPLPQVVDQANDANGINGQWYDYGSVGTVIWFVYDNVFGGDPFGEGQPTEVSYGPGDIREARLATMFEAIPVGADGIDYQATGVRARIKTEERAAAPDGTELRLGLFLSQYNASQSHCATRISTEIPSSGAPGPISWFRDSLQSCEGGRGSDDIAGWRAFRDEEANEIVLEMPASALEDPAASYFSEGAFFVEPHVFAEMGHAVTIDATRAGSDFMVGEDMPADIPCTVGCPAS